MKTIDEILESFEPFRIFVAWKQKRYVSAKEAWRQVESIGQAFPLQFIIVGQNGQYESVQAENATVVADWINKIEFLDSAKFYVIPQKNELDVKTLHSALAKRYEAYYDELHSSWWHGYIPWGLKIGLGMILAIIPFMAIAMFKNAWLSLGLPLESLFENTVTGLMQIILILSVEATMHDVFWIACLTGVALFLLYLFTGTAAVHPSFFKYELFYYKKFALFLFFAFVYWYLALTLLVLSNQFYSNRSNVFLEATLESSVFPKVAVYEGRTSIVSHLTGKYAYVQSSDLNLSERLDCTNLQEILKRFNLTPDGFIAVDYEKINNVRSLEAYCRKVIKDQNASN